MKKSYLNTTQSATHTLMGKLYLTLILLFFATMANAGNVSWTGSAGDNNWATANNWTGTGAAPVTGDAVTISVSTSTTINNVPTLTIASFALAASSGNPALTFGGTHGTLTITGNMSIGQSLTISDGGNIFAVGGNLSGGGTINTNTTLATGKIQLTTITGGISIGTVGQTLTVGNLALLNTSGTNTALGTITVQDNLTFASGGTLADGGFTITVGGNIYNASTSGTANHTGTGKIMMTGTSTLCSGLSSVSVTTGGTGYTANSYTLAVTFSAPNTSGGVQASGLAITNSSGVITGIAITNPGSGYTSAPTITSISGGGSGGSYVVGMNSGSKIILASVTAFNTNTTIISFGNLELNTSNANTIIGTSTTAQIKGSLKFNATNNTTGKLLLSNYCNLTIGNGSTFNGSNASISMNGTGNGTGSTGNVIGNIGSQEGYLTINSTGSAGTFYFDQTTPGTTNKYSGLTMTAGTSTFGNTSQWNSSSSLNGGTLTTTATNGVITNIYFTANTLTLGGGTLNLGTNSTMLVGSAAFGGTGTSGTGINASAAGAGVAFYGAAASLTLQQYFFANTNVTNFTDSLNSSTQTTSFALNSSAATITVTNFKFATSNTSGLTFNTNGKMNVGSSTTTGTVTIQKTSTGSLTLTTVPAYATASGQSYNNLNVVYAGTSPITTSNELPSSIYNLSVTNTYYTAAAVTLNSNVSVYGTLSLSTGSGVIPIISIATAATLAMQAGSTVSRFSSAGIISATGSGALTYANSVNFTYSGTGTYNPATASIEIPSGTSNLGTFAIAGAGTYELPTGTSTYTINTAMTFSSTGGFNVNGNTIVMATGSTITRGGSGTANTFGGTGGTLLHYGTGLATDRVNLTISSSDGGASKLELVAGKIGTLSITTPITYTLNYANSSLSSYNIQADAINVASGATLGVATSFYISTNTNTPNTFTSSGSGTISVASAVTNPLPTTSAGVAWAGTVIYTVGGPTLNAVSFTNVTLSNTNGTLTAGSNITVSGTFNTTAGGTLNMQTYALSTSATNINCNITTANTSNSPLPLAVTTWPGLVTFNGGATQYLPAGTYNGGITITTPSTAATVVNMQGNVTVGGAVTFTGSTTPLMVVGADTLTLQGSVTAVGTTYNIDATNTLASVVYIGSTPQTIAANTFKTSISSLIINNSNGVALGGAISTSNLTLTNGILTTTGYNLVVTNTATNSITGGSSSAFVYGPLTLTLPASTSGTNVYTFPLGTSASGGAYLPFALVNPVTGSGAITVTAQVYGSGSSGSFDNTLTNISSQYWSFSSTGNFTSADVALTYPSLSIRSLVAESNGGTYTSIGGNTVSGAVTSISTIPAGAFTFAIGTPLPLALTSIVPSPNINGEANSTGYVGQSININGTGFSDRSTVTVNGAPASVLSQTATLLMVTIPNNATLSGNVIVTDSSSVSSSFAVLGYVTNATGDWDNGSTWLGGNVPAAGSIVTINNSITVNATASNPVSSITILGGSSVTFGNADTLTASMSFTNSGTLNMASGGVLNIGGTFNNTGTFAAGAGTIVFNGTSQSVPSLTYYNLNVTNSTATAAGNITLGGMLTIASGAALDLSTYALSGSSLTTSGMGALLTEDNVAAPIPAGVTWSFAVDYNGTGAQTVVYGNYSTLTVSEARSGSPVVTFSPAGAIGVAGNFNYTTTGATATTSGSTINFNGIGTQYINNAFTFNNLTVSAGSTVTAAANFTIGTSGTLTINATSGDTAVLDMSTYTLTLTTTVAVAGGGKFKTQSTNNPPFTATNNIWVPTVWFYSTSGSQFVPGGIYNGGMIFTNGTTDTATALGNLVINGTLAIYSGSTVQMSTNTLSTNTNGTSISNPTITFFTSGTGYLLTRAGGSGTQLPKYATWSFEVGYDGGTGGVTVHQRMVPGTYTILNADGLTPEEKHFGTGINTSLDTFLITGSMIYSTGTNYVDTFTTFKFAGTGQTVPKADYYNLVLGTNSNFSPGTTEIIDSLSVGNTTTVTSGYIDFIGNGKCNQIIPSLNYDSIEITGARGAYSVILAPSGYEGSSSTTIEVSGLFSNTATYTSGAFSYTGSTVAFNGTTAQTISAANFYNLTINNNSGVKLAGNVNVANTLTLTNGILTTLGDVLAVNNTATNAINGGSSSAYIKGALTWTLPSNISATSTYTFPLGDTISSVATYMPFALVNPVTGSGTVTATAQVFSNGNIVSFDSTLYGLSNLYWSLNTSGNFTSGNVALTSSSVITSNSLVAVDTGTGGTYTSYGGSYSAGAITSTRTIIAGSQTFAVGNLSQTNFLTNYIVNGGFESCPLGTSPNVTTGGGALNNTLAGQWQTIFTSPSSSGTSVIINSTKFAGNNSLELTINSQTNRNDIRLIQVIPNTTIPPAAPMVLTFYMMGGRTGDSVVANVFQSTASGGTNGVSGSYTQPANLFITTQYWQMCKMYVDLTGWTTAQRTNMRISIRPNTGLGTSPNPSGPYPKYYWLDSISFTRIDSLHEMHDMAISVAIDRKNAALDSGFTAEADSLANSITTMLADNNYYVPVVPTNAVGFNPTPTITDTTNPYLKALYSWAATYLVDSLVTLPYSKAVRGYYTNFPGSNTSPRTLGTITENLHWLLVSPYSKYRYNPVLFRSFLTIVYATSDDYQANGGTGTYATPGYTLDGLNDWFAAAKTCYSWWMAAKSFPTGYIPNILNQRLLNASDTMGKVFSGWADSIYSYNYTNRDVNYAQILTNIGLFRNNTTWVNFANQIIDSVNLADRYPDGGYAYLGHQTECASYHGGTNNSLAKIWAVSGNQTAWNCVAQTANYEELSIEPRAVPEYYTAPAWKGYWNQESGASAEPLVEISGSGYFRTKLNQINLTAGYTNEMVTSLAFYNPNINSAALPPSSYVVYDRNIQGPRGRYGNYSYGVTMRNVSPKVYGVGVKQTPVGDLGMQTLVGAIVTQAASSTDTQDSVLNSAVLLVGSQVQVVNNSPIDSIVNWARLMTETSPLVCVSRSAASASTPSVLQNAYGGPTALATNWSSNQHWITLPDRMIGLVETYPTISTGTTSAYEVTGRVRFTYGREGTNLDTEKLVINTPQIQYTYGNLTAIIHAHNFNAIDTAYAGVQENAPPYNAYDIVFMYDSSNGGTTLYNYPGSLNKYFIVEIKNSNAVGNATVNLVRPVGSGKLSGLIVNLNGAIYSSYRNDSTAAMLLDLTNSINTATGYFSEAHFARVDSTLVPPQIITGNTLTLAAHEQVLIVSTNNIADTGKGWENFTDLLQNTGVYPNDGIDAVKTSITINTINISATKVNEGVIVKWAVPDETNIASYVVERSTNGSTFSGIATTKANGTSVYSVEDDKLPTTANALYYRIRVIYGDGSYNYSSIVKLTTNHQPLTTISIAPNPVQDKLNILLGTATNSTYKLRIITVAGVEVFNKTGVAAIGNTITIDVASLASGLYMVELTDGDGNKQVEKFVKR